MSTTQKGGLQIGVRSFLTAIAVIFVLMVGAYVLTLTVPGGEYARAADASGNLVIDTEAGFSNVLYPTNPVLLISLGLADVSYGKWFRWSFKFQLANLALTCGLLLFGLAIGY